MATLISPKDLSKLPDLPGIYKYFNSNQDLIYVGKAKNLKKRVSSYFHKSHLTDRKTYRMIKEVVGIAITIVNSEFDALLLENNLIKQYQPRYNINLKDDKSFPFIVVTHERFPRVVATRRYNKTDGTYFGPYTNVKAMNNVLDLIRKIYTIRTCTLNLTQKNIEAKKFKVCLEYHLNNCLGPCEGLQHEMSYKEEIDHTKEILKGNLSVVKRHFRNKMLSYAKDMNFELAQKYKEKHELLDKFQTRSIIVNQKLTNIDVFTIVSDDSVAVTNFMRIVGGAVNLADTTRVNKKLQESNEDILQLIIDHCRLKYSGLSKELLSNVKVKLWDERFTRIPYRGDKKKLVELSLKNALYYKKEQVIHQKPLLNSNRVLATLQADLRLKELPKHIECFDNSNIQGSSPVASMVCFMNGKPYKKNYRHYNVKTVDGPDDFKSMKEIVGRRYTKLKADGTPYPNLVVIDGGKGQLNAACEAMKAIDLYGKIPIIGIAKRLEEIYFPEDPLPIHLSKKSETLMLLQRLRDEAHRFAITFHRNKRSSASLISSLDGIPGIGPATRDKLLRQFHTVSRLKAATITEIAAVVGLSKAKKLNRFLLSTNKRATH